MSKVSRGPVRTSLSTVPNARPPAIATNVAFSYKTLTKLTSAKTVMSMSRPGIGCAHVTTHGTSVRRIDPIVVASKLRSLLATVLVKAASAC